MLRMDRRLPALCLALALCAPTALGRPQASEPPWELIPETPAGLAFGSFAELMQTDEPEVWLDFVAERVEPGVRASYSDEQWTGILEQMRAQWRSLDLAWAGTDTATRFGLVGLRRGDPLGEWFELYVSVSPDDPTLITDLDVERTHAPPEVVADKLGDDELKRELEAYVDDLVEAGRLSGVVLVARGDEVLVERAGGLASVRHGVPNRPGTRFCLGSMTKMFTACAVMQLVEQGVLALEDPIGTYLGEEWVGAEAGAAIRIEHLLSHTGGTGDFFLHPGYAQRNRGHFRDVDSFAEFIDLERPAFEPGSQFAYSNSGFILLGAILEKATGRDYHEYMREAFYGAQGMAASDSFDADAPVPDVATGYYETREGELRSNVFSQRARGCPAGSSYATARDLLTFARRFQAGQVVSQASATAMTSGHPELGSPTYGYGMELFQRQPRVRAFGHSGGGPGVLALLAMYPDSDHTVIVLANAATRDAFTVGLKLHEFIARHTD